MEKEEEKEKRTSYFATGCCCCCCSDKDRRPIRWWANSFIFILKRKGGVCTLGQLRLVWPLLPLYRRSPLVVNGAVFTRALPGHSAGCWQASLDTKSCTPSLTPVA